MALMLCPLLGSRRNQTEPVVNRISEVLWAAAGFDDTLLRWKMKPEVDHGNEKAIQPRVQA
jgi:hypothetical protein